MTRGNALASTKRVIGPALPTILGRRNAVRVARFLLDQARLDIPNRIESNGELMVQRKVLQHAPGRLVVMDIGAHFGEWSAQLVAQAAAERRRVQLHIFEPAGFAFQRLRQDFRAAAGVDPVFNEVGMSSAAGTETLRMAHEGASSASLHATDRALPCAERIDLTTVDDYCLRHRLERIDLLKCDAEGHDFEVLRGASRLFGDGRVAVAQFEYNHRWIGARRFLRDAFEALEPVGYHLGKVTPRGVEFYPGWDPELESFREANYVAVAPNALRWFPTTTWWKVASARRGFPIVPGGIWKGELP